MRNNEQHIAPETEILFEQFLEETTPTRMLSSNQSDSSDLSPASLLEALKEARALINGLESQNRPEEESESTLSDIDTRMSQLETEVTRLKATISKHMNF